MTTSLAERTQAPGYRGRSWTFWGCVVVLVASSLLALAHLDLGELRLVLDAVLVGGAAALEARETGSAMSGLRAGVVILLVSTVVLVPIGVVMVVSGAAGVAIPLGAFDDVLSIHALIGLAVGLVVVLLLVAVEGAVLGGIGGLIGRRYGPTQPQHMGVAKRLTGSSRYWDHVASGGPVVREHDQE